MARKGGIAFAIATKCRGRQAGATIRKSENIVSVAKARRLEGIRVIMN
jgi:hypothetical protein